MVRFISDQPWTLSSPIHLAMGLKYNPYTHGSCFNQNVIVFPSCRIEFSMTLTELSDFFASPNSVQVLFTFLISGIIICIYVFMSLTWFPGSIPEIIRPHHKSVFSIGESERASTTVGQGESFLSPVLRKIFVTIWLVKGGGSVITLFHKDECRFILNIYIRLRHQFLQLHTSFPSFINLITKMIETVFSYWSLLTLVYPWFA